MISAVMFLFGITAIRIIAKRIVITVKESIPNRASFFMKTICTFQSPITGIESTSHCQ